MLEPTSRNGDPIFSDTAAYDVTVIAPDDLQLITSGVETAAEPRVNGLRATTFSAAPSRDFTIIADTDMRSVTREFAGTTITSWYEPGRDASGEAVALWAEQSLDVFNELLGEYPYRELQLVQVEIFGAAGVEFPQLIYMGSTYYDREAMPDAPSSFEFTVAHEVVHQWFYNLVGNNQYAHAFIDEGLTNYLSAQVYFERVYDAEAAARVSESYMEAPFERAIAGHADEIVDTPTDAFSSSRGYVMAAYSKAPLGFAAIRETVGDEAFFAALHAYVDAFCFRVATPDDLRAAFDAASEANVDVVWTHWFEERNGTDDVTPES
jgi:aminopeptidase N